MNYVNFNGMNNSYESVKLIYPKMTGLKFGVNSSIATTEDSRREERAGE